jgi:hypothetical protein
LTEEEFNEYKIGKDLKNRNNFPKLSNEEYEMIMGQVNE